jgi:hypothetical protein
MVLRSTSQRKSTRYFHTNIASPAPSPRIQVPLSTSAASGWQNLRLRSTVIARDCSFLICDNLHHTSPSHSNRLNPSCPNRFRLSKSLVSLSFFRFLHTSIHAFPRSPVTTCMQRKQARLSEPWDHFTSLVHLSISNADNMTWRSVLAGCTDHVCCECLGQESRVREHQAISRSLVVRVYFPAQLHSIKSS